MTDKADYHSKALMNAPTDMMVGASIWYMADKPLQNEFDWYVKNQKILCLQL